MTTTPAKVQAFAHTYDDDPRRAYEACRDARPGRGAMWDQEAADAFEQRCADVYERLMVAATPEVRERSETIVGMFEPLVKLGGSERLVAVQIAEALDDREVDLLGGLIEAADDDAEMRGYNRAFDRLERVVAERASEMRERAGRYVEREEGAD